MKRIIYSPDYRDRIRNMRLRITAEYGSQVCAKVMQKIKADLTILKTYEHSGTSIRSQFGIDTDYCYIYTCNNYIFYRADADNIYIIMIYHEREDYMWRLFGIRTTTPESEQFWEDHN